MNRNKRLAEVKNLVTSIDLFEKDGWECSYGISKENDGTRHDDLIARDKYIKTFPCGLQYIITADRCQVRDKKGLTSLPDIDIRSDVDNTYFYRLKGIESLDGRVVSKTREIVISENPYLDTLHAIVNTISILESNSKKSIKDVN